MPKNIRQALVYLQEILWLVTIFLLPLIFSPGTDAGFELSKTMFFRLIVNMMILVEILKILPEKNLISYFRSKFSGINIFKKLKLALLVFMATLILASIFSVDMEMSFWGTSLRFQGLYTFSCYILFGLVLWLNLTEQKQLDRLMKVFCFGAIATSFLAIMKGLDASFLHFWNDEIFRGRLYGTMGNPNFLASYLAMLIPLLIAQLLQKKNVYIASFAFILSVIAIVFTVSRSAFLGLFIGIGFLGVIFLRKTKKESKNCKLPLKTRKYLIILLFILVIGVVALFQIKPVSNRLLLKNNTYQSIQTRLDIWPMTILQILNRPFLGYGPETFEKTFQQVAPENLKRCSSNDISCAGTIPDRAHNEILDLAFQIGIPGMLAYMMFFIILGKETLKKVFTTTGNTLKASITDKRNWISAIGVLSGIIALFISNQFGFSVTVHWVYLVVFSILLLKYIAAPHIARTEKY